MKTHNGIGRTGHEELERRRGQFEDEEPDTLPPVLMGEQFVPGLRLPSASGDFRTYETTIATFADDDVFEVRLWSDRYVAHFALDRQVAQRVAKALTFEIRRYIASRSPGFTPRILPTTTLDGPATDIFFTIDDPSTVRVEQERGGDRINLDVLSVEASLSITMQLAVAVALQSFLSAAVL